MAEIITGNLIKIIIGVIVVVVVVIAVGVFFGAKIISFFKNLFETELILSLLK